MVKSLRMDFVTFTGECLRKVYSICTSVHEYEDLKKYCELPCIDLFLKFANFVSWSIHLGENQLSITISRTRLPLWPCNVNWPDLHSPHVSTYTHQHPLQTFPKHFATSPHHTMHYLWMLSLTYKHPQMWLHATGNTWTTHLLLSDFQQMNTHEVHWPSHLLGTVLLHVLSCWVTLIWRNGVSIVHVPYSSLVPIKASNYVYLTTTHFPWQPNEVGKPGKEATLHSFHNKAATARHAVYLKGFTLFWLYSNFLHTPIKLHPHT